MGELKSQKLKSKSGMEVILRSATRQDAASILELSTAVIGEEIYQLTSGAEFEMSIEAEEKWIDSHQANPNHIILLAEMNSKIVGMLDFSNGHRQRIAHTGEFGMSVEKSVRDQGVGSLLLQVLIEWATGNSTIEKIGLNVHGNNERAIALYKRMSFEVEGTRRRDLKYGEDQYIDTVVMGRFVCGLKDKLLKAIQLRKDGKPDQALILLTELLKSNPSDPATNYQLAWTCDVMGKESEAAPFYEKAISNGLTGEDRKAAMLGLGSTYRCLGEYQKSLNVFDQAVSEFSEDRSLKVFRALTLHNLGLSEDSIRQILVQLLDTTNDQAIKAYDKALRFYSDRLSEKWT